MKVWWCQEHDSAGNESICNVYDAVVWLNEKPESSCRMVPMRLIPDNALTVENFTKVWETEFPYEYWRPAAVEGLERILAALDGETP